MNKELNDIQKSRLYGITAIVCGIWFVQTLMKASKSDELFSVYNIIFYFCILFVTGYTALSAYQLWKKTKHVKVETEHVADQSGTQK